MSEINLDYLNKERILAFQRIESLEKNIVDISKSLQEVRSIAENKITATQIENYRKKNNREDCCIW